MMAKGEEQNKRMDRIPVVFLLEQNTKFHQQVTCVGSLQDRTLWDGG